MDLAGRPVLLGLQALPEILLPGLHLPEIPALVAALVVLALQALPVCNLSARRARLAPWWDRPEIRGRKDRPEIPEIPESPVSRACIPSDRPALQARQALQGSQARPDLKAVPLAATPARPDLQARMEIRQRQPSW